jgi:hypothetical protein
LDIWHEWEIRNAKSFLVGEPKEREYFGEIGRDRIGSTIKMNIKGIWRGGVDWINLASVRIQWRIILSKVVHLYAI